MSAPLPSRERIVACLKGEKKALNAGAIAKLCNVDRKSYRSFADLLEQLAIEGTLRREGNRYKLPRQRRGAESWTGDLIVHPRGFGFVAASGKTDVFIPPEAMGAALHGDTVVVETTGRSSRGIDGRIVSVAKRRAARVAGLLRRRRRSAWLEPDDARLRGPIVVTEGADDAADGEAAVVEITRFPESIDENPEGRLVAVLGPPGEAHAEVAKIKLREQIEEEHPLSAIEDAERLAAKSRKLMLGKRTDLRNVPLLTIDPADARDHDDAVYAERLDKGFRVYVAIADVSEYVTKDSALDEEAFKRGCTIYLPDRAIPMLPQLLAADLCSLLPEQERYCMCVIADLNEDGSVRRFEVVEGLMRAAAMITYDSAARTLGFTEKPALSPQAEAFKKPLKLLAAVSSKLRRARMKRGALDLDLPEPKLTLDEEGHPTDIQQRTHDPGIKRAYQIVEELMLLANELVARWLGQKHSPAVYRVHGRPDEEKLMRLGKVAEAIGAPFDLEALQDPQGLTKWLKRIDKHPRKRVLENLLLRSLKQAAYDIVNIGHFGLASDAYLHFTSPIRRYPDLLVHRTIKHLLHGGSAEMTPDELEQLRTAATTSSTRERAAMSVEREVVDLYRAIFAKDLIGELLEGSVSALTGGGVFLNVASPFIDVFISFEGLGADRYVLSDDELSLIGQRSGERISLGDVLVFELADVSILRRTVYGRRIASSSSASDDFDFDTRPRKAANRRTQDGERRRGKGERSKRTRSTPRQDDGDVSKAAKLRGARSTRPGKKSTSKNASSRKKGSRTRKR